MEFKADKFIHTCPRVEVLIESDWNLKKVVFQNVTPFLRVLIESDWNLKINNVYKDSIILLSINRIRLEFKVVLERLLASASALVLIESDWNLKLAYSPNLVGHALCINRIRLEFKENSKVPA